MPKICRTGYEAVREDGAFTLSEGLFTEADWKLFRKKLPEWQENYMGELIKEYAAILADKGEASDKFWTLEKRIRRDKKKTAVLLEDMSRSMMISHIIELLEEKAITLEDLEGFSDNLRERLKFLFSPRNS